MLKEYCERHGLTYETRISGELVGIVVSNGVNIKAYAGVEDCESAVLKYLILKNGL